LDVVAQFYFSAAGFLDGDSEVHDKMPPEKFIKTVDGLPDFTLEGTFAPGDLNNYLASKEFAKKVTPDQQKQIQKLADCLILRKCKD
jgi:hypothetical protein